MGKLGELNVEGIQPRTHAHEVANVFTLDEIREIDAHEHARLVEQFPDAKDDYLRVKNVFE